MKGNIKENAQSKVRVILKSSHFVVLKRPDNHHLVQIYNLIQVDNSLLS